MMAETIRIGVDDVVRHFEGLEDPRSQSIGDTLWSAWS